MSSASDGLGSYVSPKISAAEITVDLRAVLRETVDPKSVVAIHAAFNLCAVFGRPSRALLTQ